MAYHSILHASRKFWDAKAGKVCVTQHMNLAFHSYPLQYLQDVLGWNGQHPNLQIVTMKKATYLIPHNILSVAQWLKNDDPAMEAHQETQGQALSLT